MGEYKEDARLLEGNEMGVVAVGSVVLDDSEKYKAPRGNYEEVTKHLRGVQAGGE